MNGAGFFLVNQWGLGPCLLTKKSKPMELLRMHWLVAQSLTRPTIAFLLSNDARKGAPAGERTHVQHPGRQATGKA
jgi:hypothetical protein